MKLFAKLLLLIYVIATGALFFPAVAELGSGIKEVCEQRYGTIEQSPIWTGILYDLVVPLSSISDFSGSADSKAAGYEQWLQIGFELRRASLDESNLPEHTVFRKIGRDESRKHVYPLAFLNYHFNRIRSGMPVDSVFDIEDNRIVDINESAFYDDRVFAVSPLHTTTYRGANTRFRMDLERWYFSNGRALKKVEIDFDDGLGYRHVPRQGDILIAYSQTGQKHVRVRALQDDDCVLHAAFLFHVVRLTSPDPTTTWTLQATTPFSGQYTTGQAYIYLAEGHQELVNPIVVSEGFDLYNDMNWEELYELLNQQELLETIRTLGYDAVVLNYTDATNYIEGNAFLLEALLDSVQNSIDSTRTIALIGPSMGGLTTRYALCHMETQQIPHRVRAWISFDSPQRGAVIPLGMQYWVDFFAPHSSSADFLRSALNSPAAREMLIAHFTDPPSGTAASDPLRTALESNFAAVGNYPAHPRKVAIANGSGNAIGVGFNPGAQLILYQYSSLLISMTGNVWALNNAASQQIFNGLFRIFLIANEQQSVTVNPVWPWDNAPGGLRNSMYQMDTTAAPYGDIIALHPNHCFIPTISALALHVEDPFFDIAGSMLLDSLSPFDTLYFPSENQEHVAITPENLAWFLSEACEPLPEPVVVITTDGISARLDWRSVEGAKSYRIFRSSDFSSWPAEFSITADTTWFDWDLSTSAEFYRVVASTDSVGASSRP